MPPSASSGRALCMVFVHYQYRIYHLSTQGIHPTSVFGSASADGCTREWFVGSGVVVGSGGIGVGVGISGFWCVALVGFV